MFLPLRFLGGACNPGYPERSAAESRDPVAFLSSAAAELQLLHGVATESLASLGMTKEAPVLVLR